MSLLLRVYVRKLFNWSASTIPIPGKISRQHHDS
jgi:hypothetical protein